MYTPQFGIGRPKNRVAGDATVKICFLRCSFENADDPKKSRHTEEALKAIGQTLTKYFHEQSYGLMNVGKFEITPVIQIGPSAQFEHYKADGSEVPAKQRKSLIGAAITAANKELGRELAKEFTFICVLPNDSPTKGRLGPKGVAAFATGPKNSVYFTAQPAWRVFAHEIGHNMGFPHAWSVLDPDGKEALPNASRTFAEYGDPTTPMGRGQNSYTLSERYRMGWIGSNSSDVRYIQELKPGILEFGAYDQPQAKGLLGGFLTLKAGIRGREMIGRRERENTEETEAPTPAASVVNDEDQRLWLSVISRRGYGSSEVTGLETPLLLAHVSSISGKGASTVALDLTPGGNRRQATPAMFGLTPGQAGLVQLVNGDKYEVRFVSYDPKSFRATVEIQPKT